MESERGIGQEERRYGEEWMGETKTVSRRVSSSEHEKKAIIVVMNEWSDKPALFHWHPGRLCDAAARRKGAGGDMRARNDRAASHGNVPRGLSEMSNRIR